MASMLLLSSFVRFRPDDLASAELAHLFFL